MEYVMKKIIQKFMSSNTPPYQILRWMIKEKKKQYDS